MLQWLLKRKLLFFCSMNFYEIYWSISRDIGLKKKVFKYFYHWNDFSEKLNSINLSDYLSLTFSSSLHTFKYITTNMLCYFQNQFLVLQYHFVFFFFFLQYIFITVVPEIHRKCIKNWKAEVCKLVYLLIILFEIASKFTFQFPIMFGLNIFTIQSNHISLRISKSFSCFLVCISISLLCILFFIFW